MDKKVDYLTNNFRDLSRFPADWGLLLFPISMSRIANAQSADECIEHLRWFNRAKKISSPTIGVQTIYGDGLYLNNFVAEHGSTEAVEKRLMYLQEVENHKFRMLKLIKKLSTSEFQIPQAFQFTAWSQTLTDTKSYSSRLKKLRKIYAGDTLFQKHLLEDCDFIGKERTVAQIDFFLEEHLLVYLMTRGETTFYNNHVQNRQKWILWCYPGKPPKALIYLHQLNPFGLKESGNKFESAQYNLTDRKLYDAKHIDLEKYVLTSCRPADNGPYYLANHGAVP